MSTRYCLATIGHIKEFIADFAPVCGEIVEFRAHSEKTPTLVVECADSHDARLWALAFACDLSHWREEDRPELGKRVFSSFVQWFGWHVIVHASEPINVPAAADLVLAGGSL